MTKTASQKTPRGMLNKYHHVDWKFETPSSNVLLSGLGSVIVIEELRIPIIYFPLTKFIRKHELICDINKIKIAIWF